MKIIFIYLGETLPKYVLQNMNLVSKRFPNLDIVFIGDTARVCSLVEKRGFRSWESPDPETTWVFNRNSLAHNPDFRDGFWFKTLARFYALSEFMKLEPSESALLIESDVWISPDFPFESFLFPEFDCAYPLANSNQGVASTFFIRNSNCMRNFLDFAEKSVLANPKSTDVTILGAYYKVGNINTRILPSAVSSSESFNSWVTEEDRNLLASKLIFSSGIFDASTWGQYLTGEDPRNAWGYRYLYSKQVRHPVNPAAHTFEALGDGVVASIGNSNALVYSLHIHSKDVRVFSKSKFLAKRVLESGLGTKRNLSLNTY